MHTSDIMKLYVICLLLLAGFGLSHRGSLNGDEEDEYPDDFEEDDDVGSFKGGVSLDDSDAGSFRGGVLLDDSDTGSYHSYYGDGEGLDAFDEPENTDPHRFARFADSVFFDVSNFSYK